MQSGITIRETSFRVAEFFLSNRWCLIHIGKEGHFILKIICFKRPPLSWDQLQYFPIAGLSTPKLAVKAPRMTGIHQLAQHILVLEGSDFHGHLENRHWVSCDKKTGFCGKFSSVLFSKVSLESPSSTNKVNSLLANFVQNCFYFRAKLPFFSPKSIWIVEGDASSTITLG